MAIISKIAWKNSGVEVIDDIYVNRKNDLMYKKRRFKLVDEPKYHPFRRFIRNDLTEKIVKALRKNKINAFRRSAGFNVTDTFNSKQQSIAETIKQIFDGEDIQTEYKVPGLDYRIDIYPREYKLVVEVDEYGHSDRDIEYEEERERKLKKSIDCEFIRINPDEPNFSINRSINEISNKKLIRERTKNH